MASNLPPSRPGRTQRISVLTIATLVTGMLLAACGGSSPGAATGRTPALTATRAATVTSIAGTASSSSRRSGLAFAKCMRANGVPDFPDPSSGGGVTFITSGVDASTPAFQAAQAKCGSLLPEGGLPGGTVRPSARTMAKLVKIATCMRKHSISQFPDPRTTRPRNTSPDEYQEITDYDGAILLFPRSINLDSPAYKQALTACGAPPLGLSH